MTQTKEQVIKTLEFETLFLLLNEEGQEKVLSILHTLEFAQSVLAASGSFGH